MACHALNTKWHAHVFGLLHPFWKLVPVCHAHDLALVPTAGVPCPAFKWHTIVRFLNWRATPSIPSGTLSPYFGHFCALACHACTSVPRHAGQVARPYNCGLLKLGVPRLVPQMARPSDFLELACYAFDTKWHAIVMFPPGVVSWHARPLGSSGTPTVGDGLGVPRSFSVLHYCFSGTLY
ncbi:hypothetical protein AHAS_Ahas13G0326700 [Arachis hypogaea]